MQQQQPASIRSRLLRQLDQSIAAAPSPQAAAPLRAQRAILHARHGHMREAREQLTGLHQLAFQSPRPELSAWLHLAEGLMRFFTDMGVEAEPSIREAAALAAGRGELEALAQAWLTHLAYSRHDLDALVRHAAAATTLLAPEHHAAGARLALTLGLAVHFSGQFDKAGAWYLRARRHAMAEGDDATQSAVLYNMAQMRTAQARHLALAEFGAPGAELMVSADSVQHYDAAVGGSALEELTQLMRAQVLTLKGEFAAARALYELHLPQSAALGPERLGHKRADLAWCCVNTEAAEAARVHARDAEQVAQVCDVDDRAHIHSRLAQVYGALGEGAQAEAQAVRARDAWEAFARQQRQWAEALALAGLDRA